jgi:hypothetical protein
MTTDNLWLAVPMVPLLVLFARALYLEHREERVLSGRPFGETTGKHRRVERMSR